MTFKRKAFKQQGRGAAGTQRRREAIRNLQRQFGKENGNFHELFKQDPMRSKKLGTRKSHLKNPLLVKGLNKSVQPIYPYKWLWVNKFKDGKVMLRDGAPVIDRKKSRWIENPYFRRDMGKSPKKFDKPTSTPKSKSDSVNYAEYAYGAKKSRGQKREARILQTRKQFTPKIKCR